MNEQSAEWTGPWAAQKLRGHTDVTMVETLTPQVLRITRKEHQPFLAGTIATPRVEPTTIEPMLGGSYEIEFIANLPRESFWTGQAIDLASRHSVAVGGLGDLFSAVQLPNPRLYVNKEFAFVERGLRQHTRVRGFERVHDRLYTVKRTNLHDLNVVLLNEYELTADHVRMARDRYGAFTAIVITNPNGNATSAAEQAAASIGAGIYMWGEFLGRLNRK